MHPKGLAQLGCKESRRKLQETGEGIMGIVVFQQNQAGRVTHVEPRTLCEGRGERVIYVA